MSSVRIALASLPLPNDREESVALALDAIADAGKQGVAILGFPETFIPGYRTVARQLAPPDPEFLDHAWSAVAAAASRANVGVVLGTERVVDDALRITALVIDRNGAWLGFQDKVQLDPSEEPIYSPGTERRVFRIDGVTIGVSICHEGWRYPETVRYAAVHGAQIVFHPHYHWAEDGSYRPTTFADPKNTFHEKALLCRAAENTVWIASANFASEGAPTTSAVVRPDGTLLSYQPYGKAGLLVADVDLAEATGLLASRLRK